MAAMFVDLSVFLTGSWLLWKLEGVFKFFSAKARMKSEEGRWRVKGGQEGIRAECNVSAGQEYDMISNYPQSTV